MEINQYGNVIISADEAFAAMYSGKINNFHNLFFDEETVDQFNKAVQKNKDDFKKLDYLQAKSIDLVKFDKENQSNWFMPKNYCPDLIDQLYSMCINHEQIQRVSLELKLFSKHNMYDLLFYLKYLVDTMRNNNIVWGVGRGSSVASYVLFLIGVHKIDSIKYGLDINEFLKEI